MYKIWPSWTTQTNTYARHFFEIELRTKREIVKSMPYRKFRYEEKTFEKKNDKTILAIFFVAKQYTKWNRQIKENMKNWSYAKNET